MKDGLKFTTLVDGLHSRELRREISLWIERIDAEVAMHCLLEKDILLRTTGSGDAFYGMIYSG